MKLKSCGFSIIALLIAVLNSVGIVGVNENNIGYYVEPDCVAVADFIEENLDKFVTEFSKESEDEWLATSVEDRKQVIDIDSNEEYTYLDFDGDNGYAIIGNEYDFKDFTYKGDLEYTKEPNILYWSSYDGFVYKDGEEYLRCGTQYLTEEELKEYVFNYDGQLGDDAGIGVIKSGSDAIENIDKYLEDRYGGKWTYDEKNSKSLTNYKDVYQADYAVYDGGEGNCTLSAFYGIFRYLRDNKNFSGLPNYEVYVDTSKDSFGKNLKKRNVQIPKIYEQIRACAIEYDYTTSSNFWTSANMAQWGNDALANMGYKSNWYKTYAKMYLLWSFRGQVVSNINAGYPVMWNQARGNYGNHSMVVKGYKTYTKTRKIWFIKWTEEKHFMEMNDNWRNKKCSTTYIDYEGYSGDLIREGFGTFVVVRDYLW